jgi:hypothetical protein
MPTVNSEIKRIIREKDLAVKSGTQSMLALLEELQQQVLDELGRAALGSWDAYQLKQVSNSIESQIADFKTKVKAEADGLLKDSWGKGQALVDIPLAEVGIYTGWHLSTSVLDTLKDFAFHRIDNLSNDAWLRIRGELNLGILGGKTPQEVAAAIGQNLTDPSIFSSIADRAEVITKTEMGRVFSEATQLRMEQAAQNVDGLEKQWIHAGHPKKARPMHLAANGQHVPVNEPFNIGGVQMMFPRAPGAPLDEVINCG